MKKLMTIVLAACMLFALAAPACAQELMTYYEWCRDLDENFPDVAAELRKEDQPQWKEYGYASLREFLDDYGITEDEYYLHYVYYSNGRDYYDEYYDNYWDSYVSNWRVEHGGTSSGLAVLLNDKYVTFADAKPESVNGRTMVPVRALMEALGGTVSYDHGAVVCSLNGRDVSFKVGGTTATVKNEGMEQVIALDAAPYMKSGRTYVPVRFFSEAAGLGVVWDSEFNTVVIIDTPKLSAQINKDFTILNKMFKTSDVVQGENFKSTLSMTADYTLFSTLNGNKNASVSIRATVIANDKAQSMNLTMNFGALLKMMGEIADYGMTEEEMAMLLSLANSGIDLILNTDEGTAYMKFPALMKELGLDPNAWLKLDESDIGQFMEAMELAQNGSGTQTAGSVGELVLNSYLSYNGNGVYTYECIMSDVEEIKTVLGDSCFTTSGSSHTIRFDRDDYEMMNYGELPADSSHYDFEELNVTLTVNDSGSMSGSFSVFRNGYDSYSAGFKTSGTFSLSGTSLQLAMDLHVDNAYKLHLNISSTAGATTEKPLTAPPAGAVILDETALAGVYAA